MNALKIIVTSIIIFLCSTNVFAQKRYPVAIDSAPRGADIFLDTKEAGVQGKTPHTFRLRPGKYTFYLQAPGFLPLSRTVEIKGRSAKFVFTLEKKSTSTSSITVKLGSGTTVDGADLDINGKSMGKLPLTVNLQPGRYLFEVSHKDYQTYRQWMDVQAGEKRTLDVNLTPKVSGTAALLIATNVLGAELYVNGKQVDPAPAVIENLQPGKYVVEARAKGYESVKQEVEVSAGKNTKVTLRLNPNQETIAATSGTVMVVANHDKVEVFVDGQAKGVAPVKVTGLVQGTHLIEGRKSGLTPNEIAVSIEQGEFKTIKLTLTEPVIPPKTGGIRVVSPVSEAEVFIDGESSGKAPLSRDELFPGPHIVSVRKGGYEEFVVTAEVIAGQTLEIQANLKKRSAKQPESLANDDALRKGVQLEEPIETKGLSSFGSHLVPPRHFTADASLGLPHIFEGRITTGFFMRNPLALDGGVEFRTYGAITEIGLHAKLRTIYHPPLSLAVLMDFGGGGGPSSRNTVYFNLGAVGSIWFKRTVTLSARAYFNFYTDRHCPEKFESGELAVCNSGDKSVRDRDGGSRFFLSAILEVPILEQLNVFGLIEGTPFQGDRNAYTDRFAGIMPEGDPNFYGRVGVSYKY